MYSTSKRLHVDSVSSGRVAMDSLIAKADALAPVPKRWRGNKDVGRNPKSTKPPRTDASTDRTVNSVALHTSIPKSLRATSPPPENLPKYSHIPNKKLRSQLTRQSVHSARSKALLKDAELLLNDEAGTMEADGEMERTWRVGQDEVVAAAGQEAARGRKEWVLDGGPYKTRYTRNGRYVLLPV